ncbi:DUF992 domain-containing protein [Oceaniglobus trochenteri]|uniref:DUF992 domain-containing protein n=1 Tax=Oceaniglobus trochenteri TaxID=2763260 RepID=UPI001CFF922B|nr:DUF992 domain-containing protein [Oceaniglobus trochenteri]
MTNTIRTAALATAVSALALPALAQTATTTETVETGSTLGYLECTVEGGFGLLIASSKDAVCTFDQAEGETQQYVGTIDKLGVDIGVSGESYMKWVVVQLLDHKGEDVTLDGTYNGVSADASVGVGLGANALLGGDNESIGLQPFSVEGKTGLNVAVGLTSLTLRSVE